MARFDWRFRRTASGLKQPDTFDYYINLTTPRHQADRPCLMAELGSWLA
jgi:hypothetical protein